MKNIEVSDEMYASLMNISKEMNTQDHRCTRMPYFFQVQETKKVPAHDGCGKEVWWSTEHEQELRNVHDMKEWVCENIDYLELAEDINTFDIINAMNDYEVADILTDNGFERFYEEDKEEYSNAFFTSKACDEHIRVNGHNLHNPINYLSYASRNPEMELVSKFLCEISGGKIHK